MKSAQLIGVIFTLALLTMVAACTTTSEGTSNPVQTTTPAGTTFPSTSAIPTQTSGISLTPGPVDELPAEKFVEFQIEKNMIPTDPEVKVMFAGGVGQPQVTGIRVRFTSAQGAVEEQTFLRNQVKMGETKVFPGTRETDRVEIWVSYTDGSSYKVKDVLVPFNKKL